MDGSGTADRVDRAAHAREPVDILGISKRLQKDPRWLTVIEPLRTRMMRECRGQGMSKEEAQLWTYGELDRLYPPQKPPDREGKEHGAPSPAIRGGVSGLGDIPATWGDLPPNASLASEIGWVQAERLRVVEERNNGAVVHLERARSPAPSWSALGWLETSIRAYAKFVDVAAKVAATSTDEADLVRREKMQIEEIRSLLAEMLEE